MLLTKVNDDVILKIRKCMRCRENIIEMFKMQIKDQPSFETLLTDIIRDKNIKLEFDELKIVCPTCSDIMKGITYLELEEKDLELLNKTPLKNVWITLENI